MAQKIGMEVSIALGEAAKLANTDVIAAYPITPQTHIVEHIADMVANGEMDAEFITVESEHSAMSACLGSAAVGARTFTATAGQGLELMHEVLYVASALRFPIVMTVANRALSGPLNIWGDHSDVMATRDCGWIQFFVENGQEAFDLTLCAFRIAEDPTVMLPTMLSLDGFHLTHVVEPITLIEKSDVDKFIPPLKHPFALRPDKPVTMGAFAPPFIYTETKKIADEALRSSKKVIVSVWDEFGKRFGRHYNPVETYRTEDAKTLLLTMGSYSETAMVAIDNMRTKGEKVGLIHLRLWRPFPFAELKQTTENADNLFVLDRCISLGGPGGPVCSEIKAAFYDSQKKPNIIGFIGGLGGRDMTPGDFEYMTKRGKEIIQHGTKNEVEMIGVKE